MDVVLFSSKTKNFWLSNFSDSKLDLLGMQFSSVEQAYQWTKAFVSPSPILSEQYCNAIMSATSPAKCKSLARDLFKEPEILQCSGSTHWDKIKVFVIIHFAAAKFAQHHFLKNQLLDTGDAVLVEALCDTFWGAGTKSESLIRKCINTNSKLPGRNMMGELLQEIRAFYQEGYIAARPFLIVGDSLIRGFPFSEKCHAVSWPGAHILETIKLATAMCHSGVETVVLLVGTNDLPADPPSWQLPSGSIPRVDKDGALLRTSPNRIRARFMAGLGTFFRFHPNNMRVIVCELLPRYCDPRTSMSGLSRIQQGVQDVNTVLANVVVSHFAQSHSLLELPFIFS